MMSVLGLIAIKRTDTVISTQWYGKAATVTMFLCVTLLILFPEMPIILANILILVCLLAVINACILYRENVRVSFLFSQAGNSSEYRI